MPYCIYLRKSRADKEAEERGEGETLARHEKALLDLSKKQNLTITRIYREVVSGDSIESRPQMTELLEDIEQGKWQGVIVMDVDRLARGDTIDQGIVAKTFKQSNTKIITPSKTYDPTNEFDEEYFEFGLFMARREYAVIKRRLNRGRAASANEGKFVGSVAPYGYKKVKLEKEKGFSLEPIPEQAEVIKLIFELYVNGDNNRRYGIDLMATKLNQMHIKPQRHDYWQKETIRDILDNPVYCGKIRWGYRKTKRTLKGSTTYGYNDEYILSDGKHEPIINTELFEQAQKLIANNPPAPVGYKSEIKNPLCGIVKCGKCGRSMVLRKGYPTKSGKVKPDYLVCHARYCDNVSTPIHYVEERVLSALHDLLDSYKLKLQNTKKSTANNNSVAETAVKAVQTEIETLTRQLNKTHDLLEQGVYTTEQFLERSKNINERIETAKHDLHTLQKSLQSSDENKNIETVIIPKVQTLFDMYDKLKIPDKNALLKEVLEKVVYLKTANGSFKGVSAEEFEITIYPKLKPSAD